MAKILVIEDGRMTIEILKKGFASTDHECEFVTDGLEGLKTAKKVMPDIILLDIMLPGMNGYKICRLLKFDKKYRNIPILMLTSRSMSEDKKLGMTTGADSFITKPFDINDLLAEIERLISNRTVGSAV